MVLALAAWCEDEELDWINEPQENQEETNDGAQADGQARRNNPDNMEEAGGGGGVARMIQEPQNPQGNEQVNVWRTGGRGAWGNATQNRNPDWNMVTHHEAERECRTRNRGW